MGACTTGARRSVFGVTIGYCMGSVDRVSAVGKGRGCRTARSPLVAGDAERVTVW